jgi:hypothetical protein
VDVIAQQGELDLSQARLFDLGAVEACIEILQARRPRASGAGVAHASRSSWPG